MASLSRCVFNVQTANAHLMPAMKQGGKTSFPRYLTRIMRLSLCSCLILCLSSIAHAATITEFEFTGNTLAPTTTAANVTVSNMTTVSTTSTLGSGFITDGAVTPSGDPQYSETGFETGGYFTFTLQADAGYQLNLTDFEFYQRLGSTGAGRTYSLEYIIDGGTPVVFGSGDASTLTYLQRTASLSLVGITDPIEFRINGLIPGNNLTTFRIDDVLLSGTVTELSIVPIPEPSTGILLVICLFGAAARRRRKTDASK